MDSNFLIAILLTLGSGLSTTIGSLIGLFVQKPTPRFIGFTLGFSAGVMILVSFVELLSKSIESIGFLQGNIAFFIGMLGIFLIDAVVPHEYVGQSDKPQGSLMRVGLLIALGIAVHNFPEGMATFAGTLNDVRVGIAIAVAIAIHNIPEGIAISAPVYAATNSRKKAFLFSFLSGLSEPAGALIAGLILLPFLTQTLLGWVLAIVGGIMVALSLDELVPAAKTFGTEHTPIVGVISGMFIMALSLWMIR